MACAPSSNAKQTLSTGNFFIWGWPSHARFLVILKLPYFWGKKGCKCKSAFHENTWAAEHTSLQNDDQKIPPLGIVQSYLIYIRSKHQYRGGKSHTTQIYSFICIYIIQLYIYANI